MSWERMKLKEDPRFGEHCSYDCMVRFEQKNEKPLNLRVIKVYNPYFLGKHPQELLSIFLNVLR